MVCDNNYVTGVIGARKFWLSPVFRGDTLLSRGIGQMYMIIRPKTGQDFLKHMVKNGENDASSSRLKKTSSVEVFFRDE